MKYFIIACEIFEREVSILKETSPFDFEISFLPQNLHNEPKNLNTELQNAINLIEGEYEGIILLYGLCSEALINISSSRYKLIVPRVHDCISIFLGSKDRYNKLSTGKIYWYTSSWIDKTLMPGKEHHENLKKSLIDAYGDDNGQYLFDMECECYKRYEKGVFINNPIINQKKDIEFTKNCCKYLNWKYEECEGSLGMILNLINGKWNSEDYLIVPIGHKIIPTYDERVIDYD